MLILKLVQLLLGQKLASGTINHVIINDGSGVMSSEAQLAVSRGGTGVSSLSNITSTGSTLTITGGTGRVIGGNVDIDLPNVGPGAGALDTNGDNIFLDNMTLDAQGRVTGAVFAAPTSDIRLKKDIQPLDGSLNKIQKIGGYNYYWKDPEKSQSIQFGVIAQELEEVLPGLIKERPDGYKGVDYFGLIPVLIEAIKEQQQIIAKLTSDVENEKLDNESLKAALDKQMKLSTMHMELMMKLQNENIEMKNDIENIKKAIGTGSAADK